MTIGITATNIKWAYSKKIDTKLTEGFVFNLCLFVSEILRSDEIGLIVWQHQPVLMVKIYKVDFETEMHYAEIINFKDSRIAEMLKELHLGNQHPMMGISGFEVFCYRPKRDKPYHPKMHPTYLRARERASRILDAMFIFAIGLENEIPFVAFAQVDKKVSEKFFKKFSKEASREKQWDIATNFAQAVDVWMREFYTDKIGSKHYKTKNRYPLSPQPLEGTLLFIITTDDDGKLVSYETET